MLESRNNRLQWDGDRIRRSVVFWQKNLLGKKTIWRTQKEEGDNIKVTFNKVTCQNERLIELVWTVSCGLGY